MIYLCRHGQTEYNTLTRYQGQVDSPLTALGRAQADAMGRRLAGLISRPFQIYASPLGRARHSARLISAHLGDADITFDPRLMEVCMGCWDGLDDAEIEAEYPGARDGLLPGQWWFHSPDGESYETFSVRVTAALADIQADHVPVKIIVAHGVVSRVIRGHAEGLDLPTTLSLPVPQDAIFAIHAGEPIKKIGC